MVINWYGEACFKIQSGESVLLSDPFTNETGLTPPRFRTDAVVRTLVNIPIPYETNREVFIADGAGEYEVAGIDIVGVGVPKETTTTQLKTIYRVIMEDMRLGFLGHIAEMPDAEMLEKIGDVDILFVPAGGAPYLDPEKAAKLARQMNAKIVVCSLFDTKGLKRKAGDTKDFLKAVEEKAEPSEKLTIKKKELPATLTVWIPKM